MEYIDIKAFAKINLSLDIVGVRDDGYHLMQMIMQSIDLYDEIRMYKNNSGIIEIVSECSYMPKDASNIAHKSAMAFFEYTQIECKGLLIKIEKLIPSGAGLGGGSADGAAVLKGLNELYNINMNLDELMQIGESVGADIPFCIWGGTALVEGIGERITSLNDMPQCIIVVAKPKASVNTKKAFKAYDDMSVKLHPDTQGLIQAVNEGSIEDIAQRLLNVFEYTVNLKAVTDIKDKMKSFGALNSQMTGSGSAVFGIFNDKKKAEICGQKLASQTCQTFLCKPITKED